MGEISIKKGDASTPASHGPYLIAHVCNDRGGWGRGFVLALSKVSSAPEQSYREWFRSGDYQGIPFRLGEVQFIREGDRVVANMVAQSGYKNKSNPMPLRLDSLSDCLERVRVWCEQNGIGEIHMPKIGSGLAGGDWSAVYSLIEGIFSGSNLNVVVYEFEAPSAYYEQGLTR